MFHLKPCELIIHNAQYCTIYESFNKPPFMDDKELQKQRIYPRLWGCGYNCNFLYLRRVNLKVPLKPEIANESLYNYLARTFSKEKKEIHKLPATAFSGYDNIVLNRGIVKFKDYNKFGNYIQNNIIITSEDFKKYDFSETMINNNLILYSPNNYSYNNDRIWFLMRKDYYEYNIGSFKNCMIYKTYKKSVLEIPMMNKEEAIQSAKENELDSKMVNYLEKIVKNLYDFKTELRIKDIYCEMGKTSISSKTYINALKLYFEDRESYATVAKKLNISDALVRSIIHAERMQGVDPINYIRLKRTRPLSKAEQEIVWIYNDFLNGLTDEELIAKYRVLPNKLFCIKNRIFEAKIALDYADDQGLLGNQTKFPNLYSDIEIENAINYVNSKNLVDKVFGAKLKSGNTVPYLVIVNIIKDYYEGKMEFKELSEKYNMGEKLIEKFTKYGGGHTNQIMSMIHLDRKRPLTKSERVIAYCYADILHYNDDDYVAKKYKVSNNTIEQVKNKYGYYRNVIDYALENTQIFKKR